MSSLLKKIEEANQNFVDHYKGKITLRTCTVEPQKKIEISKERIIKIREVNHMSREVFARCLNISSRTVEKWEQGKTHPSGLASTMLALFEKRPSLVKEVKTLACV